MYLSVLSTIVCRRGFAPGFVNYKKGALDSQPQVIKFTSCLPMVGGSLRVFRLLPPLKLIAMLKAALNTKNQSITIVCKYVLIYVPLVTHIVVIK